MTWWRWKRARAERRAALQQAQEQLREVQERRPRVEAAARTMQARKETNGFTNMIRTAMGVSE